MVTEIGQGDISKEVADDLIKLDSGLQAIANQAAPDSHALAFGRMIKVIILDSAPTPTYVKAYERLGFKPKKPILLKDVPRNVGKEMDDIATHPTLYSVILADKYGLGKTILSLLFLRKFTERESTRVDGKPHLPMLIGDRKSARVGDPTKAYILSKEGLVRGFLPGGIFDPKSAKTSRCIVLTTYTTFRDRTTYNREADGLLDPATEGGEEGRADAAPARDTTAGVKDQAGAASIVAQGSSTEAKAPALLNTIDGTFEKKVKLTPELKLMLRRIGTRTKKTKGTVKKVIGTQQSRDVAGDDTIIKADKDDVDSDLEDRRDDAAPPTLTSALSGRFSIVILDKGHKAKDMLSQTYISIADL
ncbi:hypothetical protein H2201_000002 [Coniosporium apollinis]|uniref:SNF2 N-terminal domain-containing protein n=1 Tax=Coniosporium apollinis TaxID=61459 RepID=A0ABQ9P7S6_9PEZI|nr:hypothetical protein H2201_000002 [Coniosporium apollinis]